jgi:hypothetical protein
MLLWAAEVIQTRRPLFLCLWLSWWHIDFHVPRNCDCVDLHYSEAADPPLYLRMVCRMGM